MIARVERIAVFFQIDVADFETIIDDYDVDAFARHVVPGRAQIDAARFSSLRRIFQVPLLREERIIHFTLARPGKDRRLFARSLAREDGHELPAFVVHPLDRSERACGIGVGHQRPSFGGGALFLHRLHHLLG